MRAAFKASCAGQRLRKQRSVNLRAMLGFGASAIAVALGCSESSGAGGGGATVNATATEGGARASSPSSKTGGGSTKSQRTTSTEVQGGASSDGKGGASASSSATDENSGGTSATKSRTGSSDTGGARNTTTQAGKTGGASGGGAKSSGGTSATSNSQPLGGTTSKPTTSKGSTTRNTGGGSSAGGSNANTSSSPGVRLVGRMDTSDSAGPKYAWSGSGIVARFNGSRVGVKLAGGQEYTVVLDGTVRSKLTAVSGTNTIAENLSEGEHTIELYRRTEANQGEAQFLGFDLGDGKLLDAPAAPARRIELIGDSITCGYGVEGADQNCGFTAGTENHYLTYGAIAARALGADLVTIAWSGKGVVCNYGDAADSCKDPLPTYYDRALPDRSNSVWDFSKFQPDAVVVNLGTNDFSTQQDPSQSEFESAYKSFLQHIREKYPTAYILCTNGPMLSGTDLTTVRSYIENVVKALKNAGDTKVGTFEITPQQQADGYGCDWHPSCATHQKVADALETALKKALSW